MEGGGVGQKTAFNPVQIMEHNRLRFLKHKIALAYSLFSC